ncbi:PAS domain-containing protein [Parvibaculaceae bacterium PLY_AMNH_Bact1]|nr:PAS domain-containing protein [Parvibaculaceae bacterium PLY_AMNH_Bact1]
MTFDELVAFSSAPDKIGAFVSAYRASQSDHSIGRRDLLPMRSLAPMLANITMTEYVDDNTIIFRIAGENITDRLGFNPAGRNTLDLIAQEKREEAVALHKVIIDHPCGSYVVYESVFQSGRKAKSESITFPLRKDASTDTFLFFSYHVHHEATGFTEVGEPTALGLSEIVTELVDIGSGHPEMPSFAEQHVHGPAD